MGFARPKPYVQKKCLVIFENFIRQKTNPFGGKIKIGINYKKLRPNHEPVFPTAIPPKIPKTCFGFLNIFIHKKTPFFWGKIPNWKIEKSCRKTSDFSRNPIHSKMSKLFWCFLTFNRSKKSRWEILLIKNCRSKGFSQRNHNMSKTFFWGFGNISLAKHAPGGIGIN